MRIVAALVECAIIIGALFYMLKNDDAVQE